MEEDQGAGLLGLGDLDGGGPAGEEAAVLRLRRRAAGCRSSSKARFGARAHAPPKCTAGPADDDDDDDVYEGLSFDGGGVAVRYLEEQQREVCATAALRGLLLAHL